MMLNEPSVYACIGHALGRHAPGLADLETFRIVTHHLNLAQGAALQALRSMDPEWRLGTALNMQRGVPEWDDDKSGKRDTIECVGRWLGGLCRHGRTAQ